MTNKEKLDIVFSTYIRKKYADKNGMVKCVTCPTVDHYLFMDCGHFIPRANMATRYEEMNAHPQCKFCNQALKGNLEVYEEFLLSKYGKIEVESLKARGHSTLKWMDWEIQARIKHYRNLIKQL